MLSDGRESDLEETRPRKKERNRSDVSKAWASTFCLFQLKRPFLLFNAKSNDKTERVSVTPPGEEVDVCQPGFPS